MIYLTRGSSKYLCMKLSRIGHLNLAPNNCFKANKYLLKKNLETLVA